MLYQLLNPPNPLDWAVKIGKVVRGDLAAIKALSDRIRNAKAWCEERGYWCRSGTIDEDDVIYFVFADPDHQILFKLSGLADD